MSQKVLTKAEYDIRIRRIWVAIDRNNWHAVELALLEMEASHDALLAAQEKP